jgi:23S rRNA pseudouridine2604 synthase
LFFLEIIWANTAIAPAGRSLEAAEHIKKPAATAASPGGDNRFFDEVYSGQCNAYTAGFPGSIDMPDKQDQDYKIRLSKLMSQRGLCSRREADRYIEQGWVRVDGRVEKTLGVRVDPGCNIELLQSAQQAQKKLVTIILNKPVGIVSGQAEDGYKPAISLVNADSHWDDDKSHTRFSRTQLKGLAPAGRLDIDSQGLLVLTQDGRVARRLVGENSDIEKEYLVRYQGELTAEKLALLNHGLELDGRKLKPAKVTQLNRDQLRFILKEGRKRQIRRMCEGVGLTVTGLKRVRIGKVRLSQLPEGQWRYLGEREFF